MYLKIKKEKKREVTIWNWVEYWWIQFRDTILSLFTQWCFARQAAKWAAAQKMQNNVINEWTAYFYSLKCKLYCICKTKIPDYSEIITCIATPYPLNQPINENDLYLEKAKLTPEMEFDLSDPELERISSKNNLSGLDCKAPDSVWYRGRGVHSFPWVSNTCKRWSQSVSDQRHFLHYCPISSVFWTMGIISTI